MEKKRNFFQTFIDNQVAGYERGRKAIVDESIKGILMKHAMSYTHTYPESDKKLIMKYKPKFVLQLLSVYFGAAFPVGYSLFKLSLKCREVQKLNRKYMKRIALVIFLDSVYIMLFFHANRYFIKEKYDRMINDIDPANLAESMLIKNKNQLYNLAVKKKYEEKRI